MKKHRYAIEVKTKRGHRVMALPRDLWILAVLVLIALAVASVAYAKTAGAVTVPDNAPLWSCDSLSFDPEPGTLVTVAVQVNDGTTTDHVGSYTTGQDRRVLVPIHDWVTGKKVQARASLPDIFPGVWTPWVDLDCTTPPPPPTTTPPTTTPPPTVPPTTPPSQPPVVPVTTPVIATGPGTPGDLATTGAGTDVTAIVGGLIFAAGMALLVWSTRKPKAA